ncbi:MAG: hypothetical protein ACRC8F_08995 [Cetobacterium sp.]
MKKIYKRFFDELEPNEIKYFEIIAKQYDSDIENTIQLTHSEDEEFFRYLEVSDLISNIRFCKTNAYSTNVYYHNTTFFAQFMKYYTENLKK